MKKVLFDILIPRVEGDLKSQADDLGEQYRRLLSQEDLNKNAVLQARFYVSDAANQCDVLRGHSLYQELVTTGVASFIEQPPLCGVKVALLLVAVRGELPQRTLQQSPNGTIAELAWPSFKLHLQSVRFAGDDEMQSLENQPVISRYFSSDTELKNATCSEIQTISAFQSHLDYLSAKRLTLRDNCLRTWIYVRDVDRHYAGVVKGRNEVFAKEGLTHTSHYIASTGIGGASEHRQSLVAVDFLSVEGDAVQSIGYLHAPDYLNPTHEYGVAFERGAFIDMPSARYCLVSGTASIDNKGECLYRGDVMKQTERLFLNIEKLLESGGAALSDVAYLLVYLRDVADYHVVNAYLQRRFPGVPKLLVEARVCRPEWLIEVECVSVTSK